MNVDVDSDTYSRVDSFDGGGVSDNNFVDLLSSPLLLGGGGTHDNIVGIISAGLELKCNHVSLSVS